MGDANSEPRRSSAERHRDILDGLEHYQETYNLRVLLRNTVSAWFDGLPTKARTKVQPLIQERYSFEDPKLSPHKEVYKDFLRTRTLDSD